VGQERGQNDPAVRGQPFLKGVEVIKQRPCFSHIGKVRRAQQIKCCAAL
jgi:hypothetical protein